MALSRANGAGNINLPNSAGGADAQRRAGLMSGQDRQRPDRVSGAMSSRNAPRCARSVRGISKKQGSARRAIRAA